MADLMLDFCSHEAAKHAVMRWHYSHAMPAAKLVRFGVWEGGRFVGAILYGSGANRHLASPFGLESIEACELVRVALAGGREHPTSRCLAISLKILKRHCPGLKAIVSYADTKEGHLGTIYQATNWLFRRCRQSQPYLKVRGKIEHPRSLYDRYGPGGQSLDWLRANVDPNARRVEMPDKLKYVWCYDAKLRKKLAVVAKPYPKTRRNHRRAMGLLSSQDRAVRLRPRRSIPLSMARPCTICCHRNRSRSTRR